MIYRQNQIVRFNGEPLKRQKIVEKHCWPAGMTTRDLKNIVPRTHSGSVCLHLSCRALTSLQLPKRDRLPTPSPQNAVKQPWTTNQKRKEEEEAKNTRTPSLDGILEF